MILEYIYTDSIDPHAAHTRRTVLERGSRSHYGRLSTGTAVLYEKVILAVISNFDTFCR